jgi:hypothetical protein
MVRSTDTWNGSLGSSSASPCATPAQLSASTYTAIPASDRSKCQRTSRALGHSCPTSRGTT